MALVITFLIIMAVNLSAFHYSKDQLDDVIIDRAAQKVRRDKKDLSITTLAVKEEQNVRVYVLQCSSKDAAYSGIAVFTKLPLFSLYKCNAVYLWSGVSQLNFEADFDLGLVQMSIEANDTDITISPDGFGSITGSLAFWIIGLGFGIWFRKDQGLDNRENEAL